MQNAQIGGNQSADSTYLKVITDEPDSREQILDFDKYSRTLAKIIENSTPRFTVGVFGDWGTGKTTLMLMIRDYLKKNGKILTVWFDAWRYEREKNLAVVPFLRVTKLSLEEFTSKLNKTEGRRWEGIKKGLQHTLIAFFKSTKVTYGIKDIISVETDFKQFSSNLNGNIANIDDRDYFYYHATGYLEHALDDLRRGRDGDPRMKGDPQYRIVIFIDDLDRCSPDKGLEILESIKSFFDIEGIIYVVGMNYNSIDALIKQKYSQNPNISGLDYMKKIVQLPFHIPQWNESDILNFVNSVTSNELKDSEINTELSNNKYLIVKAVEGNPREVKRFINHIILIRSVFDKPVNKLIVIQALKFRSEWNRFLEFIASDVTRSNFLNDYKKLQEQGLLINKKAKLRYKGALLKSYPSFFNENDSLRKFLDVGAADILLGIKNMGI